MLAEITLTSVNQKIVSTDDNLKTLTFDIVQNNSSRDRSKNSSYRSWPKKPSRHHLKIVLDLKIQTNINSNPINWI